MAKILLIETATEACSVAIAVDGQVLALAEAPDAQSHTSLLTLQIADCVRQTGIALADLDAVALSRGPGSYTSLRVGASVAKGICYALDKPLLAVDTLEALALASLPAEARRAKAGEPTSGKPLVDKPTSGKPSADKPTSGKPSADKPSTVHRPTSNVLLLPMLEARRQEVWTAVYDAQLRELAPPQPLILEYKLFENLLRTAAGDGKDFVLILSGNGCLKAKSVIFDERMVWSEIKKCSALFLAGPAERILQQHDFQDIAYFEPFYMKPPNITTANKVW